MKTHSAIESAKVTLYVEAALVLAIFATIAAIIR